MRTDITRYHEGGFGKIIDTLLREGLKKISKNVEFYTPGWKKSVENGPFFGGKIPHFLFIFVNLSLSYFGKTPLEGAQTILHCCLTEAASLKPGGFYVDCEVTETQGRGHFIINYY